jgi:hypothetical protein
MTVFYDTTSSLTVNDLIQDSINNGSNNYFSISGPPPFPQITTQPIPKTIVIPVEIIVQADCLSLSGSATFYLQPRLYVVCKGEDNEMYLTINRRLQT